MAGRESDADNYCRIFIIGARDCSTEDVRDLFSNYGRITDVYFPIDKATRQKKGIIYVTFTKASEAALAIEKTNGKNLLNSHSLKVVLASSRKEGSVRDPNEDMKMLRLFIVIPQNYREKDIEEEFKKFGEVASVYIVKDKKTSDGRGLAYVKFSRAYEAAVALENCDPKFRPVFADAPKSRNDSRNEQRVEPRSDRPHSFDLMFGGSDGKSSRMPDNSPYLRSAVTDVSSAMSSLTGRGFNDTTLATLDLLRSYSTHGQTQTVLEASVPSFVGSEQVNRLFDLVPGLEYCNCDPSSGRVVVKYSTPQAAAYARDKMDGMEYLPGHRISVHYVKDLPASSLYGRQSSDNALSNVQTLVDSIQKATALLQQAGIGIGGSVLTAGSSGVMGVQGSHNYGSQSSAYGSGGGERSTRNFCSVALPDRRPFASRDVPVAERLFIVAHPDTFDNDILEDVFCRFGNMIGAYFMPGKKFGYVKYASSESARKAMDVLHGEVVCGSRLKVLPAEPMRRRTDDASKRDHSTGGSSIADDDEIAAPRGKHSRYD